MTEQEKQLLLKDLCARLPYEYIKCKWIVESFNPDTFDKELEINEVIILFIEPNKNSVHLYGKEVPVDIGEIKPYLRPMSSMTEEEKEEYELLIDCSDYTYFKTSDKVIDWLNAHHFDYRGLINKSIAIEAPEGMYEIHT